MASWQSTLEKFSNIMPYLLKTGTLSDVTFLVGGDSNQKSFQAHRLLLAVRSDVFERMFFGAFPGKAEEIKIPDIDPDIFNIMLKFIYEDELELRSMERASETFAVAHKYNITQLMNLCRKYMKDNLNPNNVSLIHELSIIYNDQYLKSVCSHIIAISPEEVVQSKAFTEISFETLQRILEIIPVNCMNQLLLFESLMKWAKAEFERRQHESAKSLRQIMEPFLPKIKFLSMKSEEFTRGPAASGILTEGEIAKILMNMIASKSTSLPEWCNEEDKARPEATFRYAVRNFGKLKDTLLSPPTFVRNLPWKIMVMPRTKRNQSGRLRKGLGFFLQCNGESESSNWSCKAVAELRLVSQKGVENLVKKIQHVFCNNHNNWGFRRFMAWNDILDPEKGFIKDDTIVLEAWVCADEPTFDNDMDEVSSTDSDDADDASDSD